MPAYPVLQMQQAMTLNISTSLHPADDGRPVEIITIDRCVIGATWHISADDLRTLGINPETTERLWITAEGDGITITAEPTNTTDSTSTANADAESLSAD